MARRTSLRGALASCRRAEHARLAALASAAVHITPTPAALPWQSLKTLPCGQGHHSRAGTAACPAWHPESQSESAAEEKWLECERQASPFLLAIAWTWTVAGQNEGPQPQPTRSPPDQPSGCHATNLTNCAHSQRPHARHRPHKRPARPPAAWFGPALPPCHRPAKRTARSAAGPLWRLATRPARQCTPG